MNVIYIMSIALLGSVLGSFAGAQVWRLRARQLADDTTSHRQVDKKELRRLQVLTGHTGLQDRSVCLQCGEQLHWHDMIPIVSWLSLGGKCRYCKKPIGSMEFWLEIGLALVFAVSAIWWPYYSLGAAGLWLLGVWLVACVILAILFTYDLKWFLLPSQMSLVYTVLGGIFAGSLIVISGWNSILSSSIIGSVAIMSGVYLVIYIISKGAWIGFGDVKLGVGLGLFLADWRLAFLALFLANLIGTIVVLPLMALGKLGRHSQVPFGPFLITGTVIAVLFGQQIISWYLATSMSLML